MGAPAAGLFGGMGAGTGDNTASKPISFGTGAPSGGANPGGAGGLFGKNPTAPGGGVTQPKTAMAGGLFNNAPKAGGAPAFGNFGA